MRITEEQAQKLGIEPWCNCHLGTLVSHTRLEDIVGQEKAGKGPEGHYLFCPKGQWLAARRALGAR